MHLFCTQTGWGKHVHFGSRSVRSCACKHDLCGCAVMQMSPYLRNCCEHTSCMSALALVSTLLCVGLLALCRCWQTRHLALSCLSSCIIHRMHTWNCIGRHVHLTCLTHVTRGHQPLHGIRSDVAYGVCATHPVQSFCSMAVQTQWHSASAGNTGLQRTACIMHVCCRDAARVAVCGRFEDHE